MTCPNLHLALNNETEHVNASMLYMTRALNEVLGLCFQDDWTMDVEAYVKYDESEDHNLLSVLI